eukprot:scaffold3677_cov206-Amphora_coffeaeformis.AAC.8
MFEGQTYAQQNVPKGTPQKVSRKGRGDQLPDNGSQNGRDNGPGQTGIEKGLQGTGHAKDGFFFGIVQVDIHGGQSRNDKKVIALVQYLAGVGRHGGGIAFGGGQFCHGEKGNLHALQHADNVHAQKEQNNGNAVGDSRPGRRLSVEECGNGHGQTSHEDPEAHNDASPKEESLEPRPWGFLGGNGGFVGNERKDVLHQVDAMQ